MSRARVAILLSGRGSNFLALHAAMERGEVPARIALVVSNVRDAQGIERARELGLSTAVIPHRGHRRHEHETLVVEALRRAEVEWICLAGYMRVLTPLLIEAFPQRILNIHPSLLPAFPGLDAQKQAWDYGVRWSGCTVHLVDQGVDTGPIVLQTAVETGGSSSAEALAARILDEEHRLYPRALARLLTEPWHLEGRRLIFDQGVDHDVGQR